MKIKNGSRKRVRRFLYSCLIIIFGILLRVVSGIYLMTYEDNWQPGDGLLWSLESMSNTEWIVYNMGIYIAPIIVLCGLVIFIWVMREFIRGRGQESSH